MEQVYKVYKRPPYPQHDPWRLLEASSGGRGGWGWVLASPASPSQAFLCLRGPQFAPVCLSNRGGGGVGAMGWPRQARTREAGKPASERVGQQGSLLLASHQACQEHGWFLPHGRGGVERGGGSCPPMGQPSINMNLVHKGVPGDFAWCVVCTVELVVR